MSRVNSVKKLIAENFEGKQKLFAAAIGKPPAQVNQWLNGFRNIGDGLSAHIETTLKLPRGWLDNPTDLNGLNLNKKPTESNATILGGFDAWDSDTPLADGDCEVPFYKDIRLAAGNGFTDDIEDYNGYKLRFARSTLRKQGVSPSNAVCVSASGNSMEPVIPDGTTLGIDTADKHIKDGKIYAINHGGLLRIKILYQLPENKIRIRSYNQSEHPDEEVSAEAVSIIGRVFCWSVLA